MSALTLVEMNHISTRIGNLDWNNLYISVISNK